MFINNAGKGRKAGVCVCAYMYVCVCAYMYMCVCARVYMWAHVCRYVLEGNGYGIVLLKAQNRNPEFSVFYFHLERQEKKLNIYKSKQK